MEFPLRAGFWQLDPKKVAIWEQLYPSLDVQQELNKAWAWLDANPSRRKTAIGMSRFLVSWLMRAQPSIWRERTEARTAYEKWRYHGGCPHTPRCGNFTTCQVVSARTLVLR